MGKLTQLFSWEFLTDSERLQIHGDIRNSYWHVRNARSGRFGWAVRRKHYRVIAGQKKRLQLAGVGKREILDLLV
jgi:hypothetical protein